MEIDEAVGDPTGHEPTGPVHEPIPDPPAFDGPAAPVASPAMLAPTSALDADPWAPPPLRPGQLSPGWRLAFISGWVGVLAGFGAIWQAGRIAGIAPWWLGPESDMKPVYVIAIPFLAPLVTIAVAMVGSRLACWVGIAASLATAAIALGDLYYPGLAVVEALIGVCGLLISVASLGGRMRAAPAVTTEAQSATV